jgi:nucleotide-binding universal stress UspA family protein
MRKDNIENVVGQGNTICTVGKSGRELIVINRKEKIMYQKIVVPLDGSKLAECVLPHVEALAKTCSVKQIVFVRVVEPFRPFHGTFALSESEVKKIDAEHKHATEKYLKEVLERVKYEGVEVKTQVLVGRIPESIAEFVEKHNMQLVIIATHGRSGVSKFMLGSIADRLLRSSRVPILMVRAPGSLDKIK